MQFIPSTWSIVGVDADNDGQRNPQDVDDAALASAVYLCSGADDLVHRRRPAVRGLPLQPQPEVRRPGAGDQHAYQRGDFSSVPNGTTSSGDLSFGAPPLLGNAPVTTPGTTGRHHAAPTLPAATTQTSPTQDRPAGPVAGPTAGPTANPTAGPTGGLPSHPPDPASPADPSCPTLPTDLPTPADQGPGDRPVPGAGPASTTRWTPTTPSTSASTTSRTEPQRLSRRAASAAQ